MPLTVTVSGNRAYITGDGFAFTTSLSGTKANITGVGSTVAVNFTDPQADIQWTPGDTFDISSSSYIQSFRSFQQHHMPREINHSLKSVTSLSGVYLGTNAIVYRSIAFTPNYMHTCYQAAGGAVTRRNLITQETGGKSLPGSMTECQMVAYSDDIVYVFCCDASQYYIYKVDWSTSPATVTEMATITGKTPYDVFCCARARNGSNDVMVCTGLTDDDYLVVVLYDLANDSLIGSSFLFPSNGHMVMGRYGPQVIAQSGNYVGFATSEDWGEVEDGDSICLSPLVFANIQTGAITLNELPVYSYDSENEEYELYTDGLMSAAMDNTTGDLYYYTSYNLDSPFTESFYMRRASPPAYSPPSVPWDYGELANVTQVLTYGDGGTVAFRVDNGSDEWILLKQPDGSALCSLDAAQMDNYGALDDENEMYWTVDCDNNRLTGKSYGAGGDRNIVIESWGATSPPAGLFGRKLFMYNGYAVVSGCTNKLTGGTEHFWFLQPTVGSASESPSPSESPSVGSASGSLSPSASASRSVSPSRSASRSQSPSASGSPSLSPSASGSASASPSVTSGSASLSPSESASPSGSGSPSTSESPSKSPSASASPSPSISPSASASRSISPSAGELFSDGFESGDFSAWSSVISNADFTVAAGAALDGSYGASLVINSLDAFFCTDNTPNSETRYRIGFRLDPNSMTISSTASHIILINTDNSDLNVQIGYASSSFRVRARTRNDASTTVATSYANLTDAPHTIEVDWQASSAPGANDGSLTLYIDGSSVASQTGIDNDTRRIDITYFGNAGVNANISGTYYLDDFHSNNDGDAIY